MTRYKELYGTFIVFKFFFWVIFVVMSILNHNQPIKKVFTFTFLIWVGLLFIYWVYNSLTRTGKKKGLKVLQYFFAPKAFTDLMHKDIIRTKYFILNGWSFTHFMWGVIIAIFIDFVPFDKIPYISYGWQFAFVALFFYEVFELSLYRNGVIIGDKKGRFYLDAVWDIIFGMGGYFIWVDLLSII